MVEHNFDAELKCLWDSMDAAEHNILTKGSAERQYSLGNDYFHGCHVQKSIEKAVLLFQEAARHGCTDAAIRLGDFPARTSLICLYSHMSSTQASCTKLVWASLRIWSEQYSFMSWQTQDETPRPSHEARPRGSCLRPGSSCGVW